MKVLSSEELLAISRRLQYQAKRAEDEANILVKDEAKFDQAKETLGLSVDTGYQEVAREWSKAHPSLSAGQVVDACGINDLYIAHIWECGFDMSAQYGAYRTGVFDALSRR